MRSVNFERIKNKMPITLLVLAFLIRLPRMRESLWYDETTSTNLHIDNFFSLFHFIIVQATHPPFHFLTSFVWINLFGDSALALRIPMLFYGMGTLILSYKIYRKVFSENVGLLVLFLLSFSSVHIWYSVEARPYIGTLFWILLSLYSFLFYDEKHHRNWLVLYFVGVLFASFSHLYAIPYVFLSSGLILLNPTPSRFRILMTNFISLGLVLIYFYFKSQFVSIPTGYSYLRPFTLFETWMLFFNWFSFGNTIVPFFPYEMTLKKVISVPSIVLIQIIYFVTFIMGLVFYFKSKEKMEEKIIFISFLFILPIFLLIMNVIGRDNIYIERGVFFALPFFFGVVAVGILRFENKKLVLGLISLLVGFQITSACMLYGRPQDWTVAQQKPDWKATGQYFKDEIINEGNKIVILTSRSDRPVQYYVPEIVNIDEINRKRQMASFYSELSGYFGHRIGFLENIKEKAQKYVLTQMTYANEPRVMVGTKNNLDSSLIFNPEYIYLVSVHSDAMPIRRLLQNKYKLVETKGFKKIKVEKYDVKERRS